VEPLGEPGQAPPTARFSRMKLGWLKGQLGGWPMLVVENKNPFAALHDSAGLVKKTWGEQVAGNFGFGLVFFLAAIPAFLVILVSIFSGNIALMVGCIGLGVIYLIILGLVQSALQSIYQAAVFLYARNGQVPAGFEAELLGNAMVRK